MSPSAHFIASWLVATVTTDNPRDRKLVTLAGMLPDLDGLGMLVDIAGGLVSGKESEFHYYQQYHHYLLHGWPGAVIVSAALAFFGRRRWRVALLCLVTFHLHLLCDLIGSRGPDAEDLWSIAYGEPFFRHPTWIWSGQWRLDGWQNNLFFAVVFICALWLASKKGFSFLEFFGRRVDSTFVRMLQKGRTASTPNAS